MNEEISLVELIQEIQNLLLLIDEHKSSLREADWCYWDFSCDISRLSALIRGKYVNVVRNENGIGKGEMGKDKREEEMLAESKARQVRESLELLIYGNGEVIR